MDRRIGKQGRKAGSGTPEVRETIPMDRLPPAAIEAERCLLASMILDRTCIPQVSHIVQRAAFYQADHQLIFEALVEMARAGIAIDAVLLRDELGKRKVLDEVGGAEYLMEIMQAVPSAAHAVHYAHVVLEKAQLRQIIVTANEMLRDAYTPYRDNGRAQEIARERMRALADIVAGGTDQDVQRIDQVMDEVRQQLALGGLPCVHFGFQQLDEQTGGMGIGEMVIAAGRPSMGKSTFGKQVAYMAAKRNEPTLIISAEENRFKIGRNLLSAVAELENNRLRRGQIIEEEWNTVDWGIQQFAGIPLFIYDRSSKFDKIASVVASMKAKHGIKLVVFDYLQKLRGFEGSRYEQVTNASLELSELIKEQQVAGLVLAQLRRLEAHHGPDCRPTMEDLKESGQIEQDADGILLIHREDYYHAHEPDYVATEQAEFIIAKWRDATRGKVPRLRSNMRFQRFENLQQTVEDQYTGGAEW